MRTRLLLVVSACIVGLGCTTPTSDNGGSGGSGGNGGKGGSGGAGGKAGSGGSGSAGSGSGGDTGNAGSGGDTGNVGSGGSGNAGSGGSGGAAAAGSGGSDSGSGGSGDGPADSGASDTATPAPDGGNAAVGSGCTGVMSSFCDDYEAQTAGQVPKGMFTTQVGGSATFTVDTTMFYSGTKSAHIHVPKGAGGNTDPTAQMRFSSQFPIAMNDLHGRVMVYLTKNPNDTGKPNIHWDLLSANGGGKTYTLGSMFNDKAKTGAFMPVYQPGDRSIDTSTPFPVGRWACVQWEFKFAAGTGDVLALKMDGKDIDLGTSTAEGSPITGNHIAAWPAGAWTRLTFGYVHFSSPTPIDVDLWFDDLAFGPQEIPCPAAK